MSLLTLNQNQRISHGIRYAINEKKHCLKLIEIQIYKKFVVILDVKEIEKKIR